MKTCYNCKRIAWLAGKRRCTVFYKLKFEGKAEICPRHEWKNKEDKLAYERRKREKAKSYR